MLDPNLGVVLAGERHAPIDVLLHRDEHLVVDLEAHLDVGTVEVFVVLQRRERMHEPALAARVHRNRAAGVDVDVVVEPQAQLADVVRSRTVRSVHALPVVLHLVEEERPRTRELALGRRWREAAVRAHQKYGLLVLP